MILEKSTYKRIAISFLVLFGIFIITPMVVTIIEKNADVSIFYSAAEEENCETLKVVNNVHDTQFVIHPPLYERSTTGYVEILYTSFWADKFCPPPEFS